MNALNRVLGGGGEYPMSEKVAEIEPASLIDSLRLRRKRLEDQLNRVNTAIKAIEENPKVVEVLEILGRANF